MNFNIFLDDTGRPMNTIPFSDAEWTKKVQDFILWQHIRIKGNIYSFYGDCSLNRNDVLIKTYFAMCEIDENYSCTITINEHATMRNNYCGCFHKEFEEGWLG